MFELGGGMRGGWVVTPAFRKKAPAVQVTRFTETGIPAGHEEYPDLPSALAAHFDYLPHPLSRLSANTYRDQIKAWEEATFEHPYADELVKKKFVYMSPMRPLAGIWVEGEQSVDKSGRIGVLYRDDPLPFAKIESLQLVPITPEAKYAVALHLAELWQNRVGYSGAQENPPGEAMNMKKTRVPEELQDLVITLTPRKGPGYTFQAGSFVEFRRVGREVFKAAFTAAQKRDPFMVEANGNYVGDACGLCVFNDRAIWHDILRIAAGD